MLRHTRRQGPAQQHPRDPGKRDPPRARREEHPSTPKGSGKQSKGKDTAKGSTKSAAPAGPKGSGKQSKGKDTAKGSTKIAGPGTGGQKGAARAGAGKDDTRALLKDVHQEAAELCNTEHPDDEHQNWQLSIHDMTNRGEIADSDFGNPCVVVTYECSWRVVQHAGQTTKAMSAAPKKHSRQQAHVRYVQELAGPAPPEPHNGLGESTSSAAHAAQQVSAGGSLQGAQLNALMGACLVAHACCAGRNLLTDPTGSVLDVVFHPPSDVFMINLRVETGNPLSLCYSFVMCCVGTAYCFAALLSMILASIARVFMSLPLTAFTFTAVLLAMSYWSSAEAQ